MYDKGKEYDIQIAITMPVDTLPDSLFPCSMLERILKKGSANDGTIKVKRKQAMSLLPMLIEYDRV